MRLLLFGLMFFIVKGNVILCGDEQTAPSKSAQTASQFFSGTVTEITDEKITVNRKGFGKDSVTRGFMKDPATKIEGKLHLKAKVTVRYVPAENGDRAVHIIVR